MAPQLIPILEKALKSLILICIAPFISPSVEGQISPPGLDGAKTVSWGAIGFNQQLAKKWSTTIYAGGSWQSDPTNFGALKKAAIFVLNQETQYQFNGHWQTSFGTSLRLQDLYNDEAPYSSLDPPYRKEVRYYLRFFYRDVKGATALTYSFRPEYRTFYTPEGRPWDSPVQMRFRLKGQISIAINNTKTNFIILANEFLSATNKSSQGNWSSLEFTEDRLSTFFRHAFKKPALFLDIGLMHQLWKDKEKKLQYTTYLSFDLLFQNPFSK